jgi:uncharacterized pyridoxamine 5'-phosphate oxidase family protein
MISTLFFPKIYICSANSDNIITHIYLNDQLRYIYGIAKLGLLSKNCIASFKLLRKYDEIRLPT